MVFTHAEQDCKVVQYTVGHAEAVLCKRTNPYLRLDEIKEAERHFFQIGVFLQVSYNRFCYSFIV